MAKIVVFGAGGRAGRKTVVEAAARGHQVTAVVRDPAKYADLAAAAAGVTVVAGDVTDALSVAESAAGHDAAISTAARMDVPADEFFTAAARALADGLAAAGVTRLVVVGIGTTLEVTPGVPIYDTPEFPADFRPFSLGHAAELDVLRATDERLDWLVLAPPPVVLDDEGPKTGAYRFGDERVPENAGESFAYADLAAAVVDEAENPQHHRALVAVAS